MSLDATFDTNSIFTAELRRAIRSADTMCLDFDSDGVTIRLTKSIHSTGPFAERERTIRFFGFRGTIEAGVCDDTCSCSGTSSVDFSRDRSNRYAPTRGCWILRISQLNASVRTAFNAIPIGAELSFTVALDALSNSYCAKARLHGDLLRMTASMGKVTRTFTLDASVCAHNTARFGYMG